MVTLLILMIDLGRISTNAYFQAWPGWSVSPPRPLSLHQSVTDQNLFYLALHARAGTGAKESEVAHTSTLTSNIHSLFISFYRPTPKRWKIVIEKGAFPSDWVSARSLLIHFSRPKRPCTHHASLGISQYAIHSHPALHSAILSPEQIENAIVPLSPRAGEDHLRTEDVVSKLAEIGDEVAVVWIGCVQYYTGQFFEVEPIARKTHEIVSISDLCLAETMLWRWLTTTLNGERDRTGRLLWAGLGTCDRERPGQAQRLGGRLRRVVYLQVGACADRGIRPNH
jgi:hypothetical protein